MSSFSRFSLIPERMRPRASILRNNRSALLCAMRSSVTRCSSKASTGRAACDNAASLRPFDVQAPGDNHGVDTDAQDNGAVTESASAYKSDANQLD